MLEKISVCNYRTFPRETEFELAPLTILLGINSSGKSSVTRLLPLFAQSLSRRSAGPILWVTDNLDYGSFSDNIHNNDATKKLRFKLSGSGASLYQGHFPRRSLNQSAENRENQFEYAISIAKVSDNTSITSIEITFYGETLRISEPNPGGFASELHFNGKDLSHLLKGKSGIIGRGFFPELFFFRYKDNEPYIISSDEFIDQAVAILSRYAHANASKAKLKQLVHPMAFLGLDATIGIISRRASSIPSLQRNLEKVTQDEWQQIWVLLFLYNIGVVIDTIKNAVESDITLGGYIGPVRARASRYYRRQELAVDQIDSTGDNLAMYLNSLTPFELEQINADLGEFFGHEIAVDPGEGHISLRIGAKDAVHTDNLADVGFGFTQLLPVIAQVHAARRGPTSSTHRLTSVPATSPIFAVEQPELHLHPAYQAKLGSYLVHAAQVTTSSRIPQLRFLIETHSEQLVNAVASGVANGEIAPDLVRIYLFERRPDSDGTEVVRADIKPNGEIPNWPYGFFTSGRLHPAVSLG